MITSDIQINTCTFQFIYIKKKPLRGGFFFIYFLYVPLVKTYRDVDVSNSKPTGKARVWVNTASNDSESQDILLPQVDDNNVSDENTWSSKKIDSMFGTFIATRNAARLIEDCYVSSASHKRLEGSNSYHNLADDITLHAGETIYVECTATKDVAVIARKYNNNYVPILISEGDDQSVYTFTAPDDMLISISAWYKWNNVYCVIPRIKNDYALDITPSLSMFENFGVVGDSYASGEVAINGYIDYYNVSWGQIIARMCGNKCTNFSAGGLTTRSWLTSPKGKSLLQSSDAQQLYILALGINDYYHLGESYLGTPDDMISKADTFYGNYATIIELIQAKTPNSKIVISTTSSTAAVSSKFNTAIINIANAYKIPCIRQDRDVFFKSSFYCNHMVNGHPVAVVYSAMAKALKRLIETAMMDNLDYFTDFTK